MENSNYIAEAFQKLNLVEDDFNFSADVENANDLRSYIADDIELPAEEKIIDVAAEEEEDLQDTYVGKVILECSCCHTRIYKDLSEVVLDDETNLANVEELCQVCNTASGFNVIGKIEAFSDENSLPEEESVESELPADDLSDEVIEEAFKDLKEDYVKESITDSDDISEAITEVTVKTDEGEATVNAEDAGKVTVDLAGNVEEAVEEPAEEIVPLNDEEETTIEANEPALGNDDIPVENEVASEEEVPMESEEEEAPADDELVDLESEEESEEEPEEEVEESLNESKLEEESLADRVKATLAKKLNPVKEDCENCEEVTEECNLEEEDANLKEKVRQNLLRKLNLASKEETFEENFNKLGTAYLKRVYENVNDFSVNNVVNEENNLVVEGVINFASGNKKDTKFVFENKNTSAKGVVSYTGMNETFSNAKKAFNLRGKEVNNKFIPESMVYRYNTNILNEDNSSEVFKVCGRVIVK